MGSCGSPRPDLILCTNLDHRASIIGLQPPIGIGTGFQLAPGRPAVVATLSRALLREDAGLHAYQMLEAGVHQFGGVGQHRDLPGECWIPVPLAPPLSARGTRKQHSLIWLFSIYDA